MATRRQLLREAIAEYTAHGWAPIALGSDKRPIQKDWVNRATSNPSRALALFNDAANAAKGLGVVCGTPSNGLLVIDLDVKNGKDGIDQFYAVLSDEGIEFPETRTVETPSGGRHYYLQMPEGTQAPNVKDWRVPGIDIQGEGAQVAAPPTVNYQLISGVPVAPIPEALLALLPEGTSKQPWEIRPDAEDEEAAYRALKDALVELSEQVEGGRARNQTLYTRTITLADFVTKGTLPRSVVERTMYAAARDVGLEHKETIDSIASALSVAQEPDRAARFVEVDWDAVFAQAEEPVDWLVEPLLERGTQVAIYSEAKAGKSLLALEIAARLAAGWSQFEDPAITGLERRHVVYIDMENRTTNIGERLMKMGMTPADVKGYLHLYSFPLLGLLDSKGGGEDLLSIALRDEADVVIIDTLSRVVGGAENDNDTYNHFFEFTGVSLKQHGIALLRLDHSGKDAGRGMRGASSKTTDVDAVWEMQVEEESQRVILHRTHDRNAHGRDYVHLTRRDDPLHHSLDQFDIPDFSHETTEQRVERVLKDSGESMNRQRILSELKKAGTTVSEDYLKNNLSKWAADERNKITASAKRGWYEFSQAPLS